jgi:hypothetical protein
MRVDRLERMIGGQRRAAQPRLELGDLLREALGCGAGIRIEREGCQPVGPGRATDAQVDAARCCASARETARRLSARRSAAA